LSANPVIPLPMTDSDWAAHMMTNVRKPWRGGAYAIESNFALAATAWLQ
jgi:hypothetical protein